MYNKATQAHLIVTNYEGVPEQYRVTLTLSTKKKTVTTWNFTLANNETWQVTVAYTLAYKMVAAVYIEPNATRLYDSQQRHVIDITHFIGRLFGPKIGATVIHEKKFAPVRQVSGLYRVVPAPRVSLLACRV